MSPPDDHPDFALAEEGLTDEQSLDEVHKNPAYLKILDEIDLDDDRPGISAEDVRAWVESLGTGNELPKPRQK